MSADEDTELRDLVAQTLETNGTLGKIRAQLRASVFLALDDQENGQNKTPFVNKDLQQFLSTKEGQLTASLVQEFMEFFNLEFSLAVFKPETCWNEQMSRSELIKDLNIKAPPSSPLITSLLREDNHHTIHTASGDHNHVPVDLTDKQIEDAKKKFDFYDKDHSGAIDKDELRELFLDMFPNFHQNMLERYVNDEFKAADKNFSSSIDFDEFLGMYKRLFILCRTVVAGDVAAVVSPSHRQSKNTQQQSQRNTSQKNVNPPEMKNDTSDRLSSDIEEDPFFDDIPIPASSQPFNTLSNDSEKSKDSKDNTDDQVKGKGGMSSLDGLPSLNSGRGSSMGSLAGAPPLGRPKSPADDSQNDDFEYEDDFSPEHSLSQKTPGNSKSGNRQENGSIAEEIDDEEIDEDISIEADDLLQSEKSGFDDLTADHSISQADGGFDYMEDPAF